MSEHKAPRIGVDSYLEWLKGEGIPTIEDFGVDLFKVETKPWARLGVNGAAVHLKGRGDFVSMFVLDIGTGRGDLSPAPPLRGSPVCSFRTRQHDDRGRGRTQAHVRMGPEEPVRDSAQYPIPALQRQRFGKGAARDDHQSAGSA